MKPIAEEVNKILRNVFGRHDKVFAEIMINWPKITGIKFSTRTFPTKISTITDKGIRIKVLYVKASDAATSLELNFYQEVILERIAIYFGHRAIDKLLVRLV